MVWIDMFSHMKYSPKAYSEAVQHIMKMYFKTVN